VNGLIQQEISGCLVERITFSPQVVVVDLVIYGNLIQKQMSGLG